MVDAAIKAAVVKEVERPVLPHQHLDRRNRLRALLLLSSIGSADVVVVVVAQLTHGGGLLLGQRVEQIGHQHDV